MGDLAAVEQALERALTGFRDAGHRPGEASVIGGLSRIHHDKGLLLEARSAYRRALEISRHIGSIHGQAVNLFYLGSLCADRGDSLLPTEEVFIWKKARAGRRYVGSSPTMIGPLVSVGRF